jgi:hypothetical protein
MYKTARIVLISYQVDKVDDEMLFAMTATVNGETYLHTYTVDEQPADLDEFFSLHGYPVQPYLMAMEHNNPDIPEDILAIPDQMAWVDFGGYLHELDIDTLNYFLRDYDGFVKVYTEDNEVYLEDGKVVIAEFDVEEDDDDNEDVDDNIDWEWN